MKRRLIYIGLLAIVLACIAWLGRSHFSLDELAHRERQLRELIQSYAAVSWIVGFILYFLLALVPGTRGKAVVTGWLFGFWQGLVLVNIALTAAALVAFFISRYLVRDIIEGRYSKQLLWANKELEREGAWYVIVLRILPVPYSLTNYLLGATKIDVRSFWWATHLGLLPSNIAFVFVGSELPSLSEVSQHGMLSIFSWKLIIGVGVLSALPLIVHWLVRQLRRYGFQTHVPQSSRLPQ